MSERKRSSFLDLDDVEEAGIDRRPTAAEIARNAAIPSREGKKKEPTEQLNMRLKMTQYDRFLGLCERHGKSRPEMLKAMMDRWER